MKSDKQLKRDVIAQLEWEPSIDATKIGVEVNEGIVTLVGHVNSNVEKIKAEEVTQHVAGVKGVALRLECLGSTQCSDADIAHTVRSTLEKDTSVPNDAIHIGVENGWVTLSGEVELEHQRDAVEGTVRTLAGVKGISNFMTLKPVVVPSYIDNEILG